MLTFRPLEPRYPAGFKLQSLRIHVRDHKLRVLSVELRTLEAHYGAFSLSQARRGVTEARRLALGVSYGRDPQSRRIAGCDGRVYELGPDPEPDDIDGRIPSVVVWHDGEMFYMVASVEMPCDDLVKIAESVYARPARKWKGPVA
jgi:hypothetical protein